MTPTEGGRDPSLPPGAHFALKRLSEKHKQIASLLAQGLGRSDITKIVKVTPEYVTMLTKQPLFKAHLEQIVAFVDVRMQALYEKSVDVLGNSMLTGSEDTKLRAAQAVLKAVGKDGSQEKTTVNVKFVVQVPTKASSTAEWEKANAPGRLLEHLEK